MRVKDDVLVSRLRKAMNHIDDALQKTKNGEYRQGINCDLEDAIMDINLAFRLAESRRTGKGGRC